MTETLSKDQQFLRKLTDTVIANLQNEKFNVKDLASESGFSLYSVSRRLYSLKKQKPSQFIREVRLQKAFEMLINGEYTASEVSFKVGFNSPAYFNKCFHDFFGYTPGEVKKLDKKNHDQGGMAPSYYHGKKRMNAWRLSFLTFPGIVILAILVAITGFLIYRRINASGRLDNMITGSDGRIAIAVIPFRNMTNDTIWNIYQDLIQLNLISSLSNNKELQVRHQESINSLIMSHGLKQYASISPGLAGKISEELKANLFVYGNIEKSGTYVSISAELINSKTRSVLTSFKMVTPSRLENVNEIVDSLSLKLQNYLLISKIISENRGFQHEFTPSGSTEAMRYYIYGSDARGKGDFQGAIDWCLKALALDSNFIRAAFLLENSYSYNGEQEKSLKWLIKNYTKRYDLAYGDQLYASWAYAFSFESPADQIMYLKQRQENDDQDPSNYFLLGIMYNIINQYDKAIPELERNLEICRRWGKDFMKNNSAYTELGKAYHKTGQYKKEKRVYEESEKYIPDDASTIFRQAILSFAEEDSAKADLYVRKYVNILKIKYSSPAWNILRRKAELYAEAKFPDKATQFYRNAVSLNPNDPELLMEFAGFLAENNGDIEEFTSIIDKAISLARSSFDYCKYLDAKGWGLFNLGRNKEALEILQKVMDSTSFKLYKYKFHLEEVQNAIAEQKL
jgi:AraC-like DNA-binding protein/tetratricopeptide (TPR) repeat protein